MELVLVDTSQIQSFIFGSNRLRENAGASFLVHQATEAWPDEIINETESSGEKIYSGGGNVLLKFGDSNEATAFIRKLSEKVIAEAPGLQIAFARHEMEDNFYQELQLELRKKKRLGETSVPLLGLGVTRRCQSIGLPASGMISEKKGVPEDLFPASCEVIVKDEMGEKANERLSEILREVPGSSQYEFPWQLDKLGRSEGEHSYIAVVHIDGDGMGRRIQKIAESKNAADSLTEFSNKLKIIGSTALANVLKRLVGRVENGVISHKVKVRESTEKAKLREITKITLNKNDNNGKLFLPFRPIIFGGDDLTFVSDGRLGIALALAFMQEFEKQSEEQELPDGKATASAGIVIVKVHYPFARAYALAEELCQNAKKYKRKEKERGNLIDSACFDWHFALSGLSGDLDEIRDREYTAHFDEHPSLLLRPYAHGANSAKPYQAWQNLEAIVKAFQDPQDWLERRNKLHALETALRQGPKHVGWFRQKYNDNKELPSTKAVLDGWKDSGWGWDNDQQCCGYFDALELADWYMPLVNENGGKA